MATDFPTTRTWLSLTEAAQQLGVTPVTLRRWADEGAIPHMITPGGHRRFTIFDIEQFTEERRRFGPGSSPENLWVEAALTETRNEIIERQGEQWLVAVDNEDRERKRLLGRKLLGLLLRHVSSDEEREGILEEARAIGRAHATIALEHGLPLTAAIRATMFFRDTLVEVALDLPTTFQIQFRDSKRLLRRINALINAFQLTIVEAYEQSPGLS